MEPTRHALTDSPTVNVSEKDDQSQHGAHQGMHQQTYNCPMWSEKDDQSQHGAHQACITDLPPVNMSEKDDQSQHGAHQTCINRLTDC